MGPAFRSAPWACWLSPHSLHQASLCFPIRDPKGKDLNSSEDPSGSKFYNKEGGGGLERCLWESKTQKDAFPPYVPKVKSESRSIMSDSAAPWTIQSMGFSRPEYWSGEPFPSPRNLPDPGLKPRSSALQADSSPAEPPGKSYVLSLRFLSFVMGTIPLPNGIVKVNKTSTWHRAAAPKMLPVTTCHTRWSCDNSSC